METQAGWSKTVVIYSPTLKVSNLEMLPPGTGARYLECIRPHIAGLPLIAKAWRRTVPENFDVLVDMNARSISATVEEAIAEVCTIRSAR